VQIFRNKNGKTYSIGKVSTTGAQTISEFTIGKTGAYAASNGATGATTLFWKTIECNISTEFVLPYNNSETKKWIKT
jgi:hypothetical protein